MSGKTKTYRRFQRPASDSSSSSEDEQDDIKTNPEPELSDIELPETDDEDDEPVINNRTLSKKMKSLEVDSESDEEDNRRRTMYEAESDEDEKPPVEDNWAIRKSVRKSINPLDPELSDGSESDEESDVIESSDDEGNSSDEEVPKTEDENEESFATGNGSMMAQNDSKSFTSDNGNQTFPLQSSQNPNRSNLQSNKTINLPLKNSPIEDKENKSPPNLSDYAIKIESPNSEVESINESLESEVEKKYEYKTHSIDTSDVVELSDDEIKEEKRRVSRSDYNSELLKKETLEQDLKKTLKLLDHAAISLPDKGAKLKMKVEELTRKIDEQNRKLQSLDVDENLNLKNSLLKNVSGGAGTIVVDDDDVIPVDALIRGEDWKPKFHGKIGLKHFEEKKALTLETIEDLHEEMKERPKEDDLDDPPKYLKVQLKNHQLHALKFMRWRETQKVKGGILADDMGLGKTLTSLSLILRQIQIDEDKESESESEDDDGNQGENWKSKGRRDAYPGGTLVVCPAAVVMQWENEIKTKIRRGALDHNVFHGPKRIYKARELAKYDVVITSYQTVASEFKNKGCLFNVKFHRIILDEGHIIRNHKTQNSIAVCELMGNRRWVLSGTPVQNKEFDLFAVIKFLRYRPFDDLHYWKNFLQTSSKAASSPRVQKLLESILLRRTKEQIQEVEPLPGKSVETIPFKLNAKERIIYNRLMAHSQAIFAEYLKQQQTKNSAYCYDHTKLAKTYSAFSRKYKGESDEIQQYQILVLLLRLRQACCHTGLIKEMVEKNELNAGFNNNQNDNDSQETSEIARALEEMNLLDHHDNEDLFDVDNEVFDTDEPSSKINMMMEKLKEIIKEDHKVVVVSQWTAHLEIVKKMLCRANIGHCEFNGKVPVKDRNNIIENFNDPKSRARVMLLSLTCGGVGINLVGANVMFIMDLHWNPQLEKQGQDRIYRFGQKKPVTIYKFICEDSIEERVLQIQLSKLEIAESALTGTKANKLSINDLKVLFGVAETF